MITHLGLFGFDKKTKKMSVEALHPGVRIEDVKERTGFELVIPDDLSRTTSPSDEELRILLVLVTE